MSRRQHQPRICSICYTEINSEKAVLPCGHQDFCASCIKTWSLISNKCPLCMIEFKYIEYKSKKLKIEVSPVNLLKYEDVYQDTLCEICESGSNAHQMLLCDSCDCGFHTYCLNLRKIPNLDQWYCSFCFQNIDKSIQILQKVEIAHCKERNQRMDLRKKSGRVNLRRSLRLTIN